MGKMGKKRVLFGASYSVIEPLGLLHLGGLARDLGWERDYVLVKDHNFDEFFETVRDFKPEVVGFNIYTGNHLQLHEAYDRLKRDHPNITTIIGGPHATYFPSESVKHSDHVVMSEGFAALEEILTGNSEKGIHPMMSNRKFPRPDRETFYANHEDHAKSHIKSFITMTGCPYKCTYCYNSSGPEDISAPKEIIDQIKRNMSLPVLKESKSSCSTEPGSSKLNKLGFGRLFPFNVRDVDDVITELREIREKWDTQVLYCQDDVHGFDIKDWLPEFARRYVDEVGIPYHAQMRWEMTKEEKRLDLLREAGCFGLTLAIEAADYNVRRDVLDRAMPEETMFRGMKAVKDRGFKIRTEQITGLPYGATEIPTKINLDADLELVELNVRLRKEAGGPDMAWGSTLAPYKGTKLGLYCEKFGFYRGNNSDVPDSFFEMSVMRFLNGWVGPSLEQRKDDDSLWLSESELYRYRQQNAELRRIFNFVTLVPDGHVLARNYLTSTEPFSYERLGRDTRTHLVNLSNQSSYATESLEKIDSLREYARAEVDKRTMNGERFQERELKGQLEDLAPVLASLPKSEMVVDRAIRYAYEKDGRLTPKVLSTAVRHHLYDKVLYFTGDSPILQERKPVEERYPAKF